MEAFRAILFILCFGNELLVLHEVCQETGADEDSILASRRVVHRDRDSLENGLVALAFLLDILVCNLLLQSRGETRRHCGTSG